MPLESAEADPSDYETYSACARRRRLAHAQLFILESVQRGFRVAAKTTRWSCAMRDRSRDLWQDKQQPGDSPILAGPDSTLKTPRIQLTGRPDISVAKALSRWEKLSLRLADISAVLQPDTRSPTPEALCERNGTARFAFSVCVSPFTSALSAKSAMAVLRTPFSRASGRDSPSSQPSNTFGERVEYSDLKCIFESCRNHDQHSSTQVETVSTQADDATAEDELLSPFAKISSQKYAALQKQWLSERLSAPLALPPLNLPQRDAGTGFLHMCILFSEMRRLGHSKHQIMRAARAKNLHQLHIIHGGGGAGKSTLLHHLRNVLSEIQCGQLFISGYTGVSVDPYGSPTLMSSLSFGRYTARDGTQTARSLSEARTVRARSKFERESGLKISSVVGIVVDEVSFISAAFIGKISQRCADLFGDASLPFGGLPVLFVGDNFQKPPVTEPPWFVTLVKHAVRDKSIDIQPSAQRAGVDMIRAAPCFFLSGNMRAMEDHDFVQALHRMRRTNLELPITPQFFDSIKPLSKEDIAGSFRFGPFGTVSCVTRNHINIDKIRDFAMALDRPLFKWKLCVVGTNGCKGPPPHEVLDNLYDSEPTMFGYYVEGAPVLLTENVQATRHVVNGTRGLMHSLICHEDETPNATERRGYHEVTLLHAPTAMNVVVGATPPRTAFWHGELLPDLAECMPEAHDVQIVPIFTANQTTTISCTSAYACINEVRRIEMKGLALQSAFAFTDYRVQGRSLGRLVIDTTFRPTRPFHTACGFYVLVSRVRTRDGLRLLKPCAAGRKQILKLQFPRELSVWNASYDNDGRWSDTLAAEAFGRHDHTKTQHSRKKRNCSHTEAAPAVGNRPRSKRTCSRSLLADELFSNWPAIHDALLAQLPLFNDTDGCFHPPWLHSGAGSNYSLNARIGDVWNPQTQIATNATRYQLQRLLQTLGFECIVDDGVQQGRTQRGDECGICASIMLWKYDTSGQQFMNMASSEVVDAALSDERLSYINLHHALWCNMSNDNLTPQHIATPLITRRMDTHEIEKILQLLAPEPSEHPALRPMYPVDGRFLVPELRMPADARGGNIESRSVIVGARDEVVLGLLCNIHQLFLRKSSMVLRFISNTQTSTEKGHHWLCGLLSINFHDA